MAETAPKHIKKENRKTGRKWRKVLAIIIIVLVALGLIFRLFVYDKLISKVSEEAVSQALASQGYTQEQVDSVLSQMSSQDKATVENIIKNHDDPATVKKALGYASSGDTEALVQLAQQELTPEEQAQLEEIYARYGSTLG